MNTETRKVMQGYVDLEVTNRLRHVYIDYNAIDTAVNKYWGENFSIPNWRFRGVYPEREWAYAALTLIANCFNAHFNIFETPDTKYSILNPAKDGKPFSGSFAMQRIMYGICGEGIIQALNLLPCIESAQTAASFFGGLEGMKMPSPELKSRAGVNFVEGLHEYYNGNPLNLLEEACILDEENKRSVIRAFNGGRGLVELLVTKFPVAYGEDVQKLQEMHFPFYKRAQLVAVLLHGRALDSKGILPLVADIDEIGPIADYEVPKSLRYLRVLKYSRELAERVDGWREISKDSDMEIELRAATVVAVVELMNRMNFKRAERLGSEKSTLNICHIDYWLWKMGKEAKNLRPHLTRTNAY